jgi:hypothetical protein
VNGSGCEVFEGNITAFACINGEKPRIISIKKT